MQFRSLVIPIVFALLSTVVIACDDSPPKDKARAQANAPASKNVQGSFGPGASRTPPKIKKNVEDLDLPFQAIGPVAVIDGEELSAELYNATVRQVKKMLRNVPSKVLPSYKKQLLMSMVDRYILDKQVKAANITVSDEEVNDAYRRNKSQSANALHQLNFSAGEDKDWTRKHLLYNKLVKSKFDLTIDDATVKAFYDKYPERYSKPEQVEASHILLKLDKKADAKLVKKVRARAEIIVQKARENRADFAALAKAYSEGPTATRGGKLGFFSRRRMVKPFSEAAFKLKKGQVSAPVRTQFGFHIINVTNKKSALVQSFTEVKPQIRLALEKKIRSEKLHALLNETKLTTKIELKAQNIRINVKK